MIIRNLKIMLQERDHRNRRLGKFKRKLQTVRRNSRLLQLKRFSGER